MNVLVLNAGSSTLKFQLLRTSRDAIAGNRDERLVTHIRGRPGAWFATHEQIARYVKEQAGLTVNAPAR